MTSQTYCTENKVWDNYPNFNKILFFTKSKHNILVSFLLEETIQAVVAAFDTTS